jgi:hypothetical protein
MTLYTSSRVTAGFLITFIARSSGISVTITLYYKVICVNAFPLSHRVVVPSARMDASTSVSLAFRQFV